MNLFEVSEDIVVKYNTLGEDLKVRILEIGIFRLWRLKYRTVGTYSLYVPKFQIINFTGFYWTVF